MATVRCALITFRDGRVIRFRQVCRERDINPPEPSACRFTLLGCHSKLAIEHHCVVPRSFALCFGALRKYLVRIRRADVVKERKEKVVGAVRGRTGR